MAELLLNVPQNSGQTIVPINEETTTLNLSFDIAEALFEKVDNNLEIYFEQTDSTLVLQDFYSTYSAENMPDFLVDNGFISGEEFFAALDEALMPAAGPENNAVENTHRYDETDVAVLASGIAALGDTAGGSAYERQGFQGEFGSNGNNNNNEDGDEGDEGFVVPEIPEINATITITAPEDVDENATHIEYTVSVDVPPKTDLVIEFDNGDKVTIPAGKTEVTYEVEVREDDAYNDDDQIIAPEITDHEGGGYDNVEYDNSNNEVVVTDDVDPSTLTLEATKDTLEGDKITYTVKIDNAPKEDLKVEVKDSDGNTHIVTIPKGETSGSLTVDAPSDDVYKDAGEVTATLGNVVSGGSEFEELTVDGSTVSTNVADTTDTTKLTLRADADVVGEGGTINYKLELTNPTDTEMTVTVTVDGKDYDVTIGAGESEGTLSVPVRGEDAYEQGNQTIDASIKETSGGNFEKLETEGKPSTVVTDEGTDGQLESTTIKIIAPADVDENATSVEYTIEVSTAPKTDLVVELSNGQKVTIEAGKTTATFTEEVRADNAYNDENDTIAPEIVGHEGGNYEDVTYDNSDNTTIVKDDVDTTTLSLDVEQATVEAGGTLNFTLNLTDENGDPVEAGANMTVTVIIDGEEKEVVIEKGQSSVSFESVASSQDDGTLSAQIESSTDGNFEDLDLENDTAESEVQVEVENPSITVDEEGLDLGTNADANSETATWNAPEGYKVVLDESNANGNPYTLGTDEDGNLTVTLDKNVTDHKGQGADDTVTRPNSVTVTLENAAGETITVDVDVTIIDDAPVISDEKGATVSEDGTSASVDAVTTNGIAQAEISVDLGADLNGATIQLPPSEGATVGLGVKWNGSEWEPIGSWMEGVSASFNEETGEHTLVIGDVTMTSSDNQNWTVTYETVEDGRDDITLNFTDGDGDKVSHEILSNSPIIDLQGSDIVADDSALADGTGDIIDTYDVEGSIDFNLGEGSTSEHSFTVNLKDGTSERLNFENGSAEVTVNGGKVIFTLNEDNTSLDYTFVQSEDYTHTDETKNDETADVDSFNVTISDAKGNSVTSSNVNISINDDGPVISTTDATISEDGMSATVEGVVTNGIAQGTISIDFGADMEGAQIVLPKSNGGTSDLGVEWNGSAWVQAEGKGWPGSTKYTYEDGTHTIKFGDVTMTSTNNQDWTVSYEHSEGGRESITLDFIDADGDKVSHDVTSAVPTIETQGTDILADDSVLAGGTDAVVEGYNIEGSVDFSFGDGEASEHSFTVNVGGEAKELNFDKSGNAEVTVNGGKLVFTLNESSSSLDYTFVQSEAYDGHDDATDRAETDLADSFTVTITDSANNSVTSESIDISINDDGPQDHNSISTTTTSSEANATVRIEFGADDGDGKSLEFGESTFTFENGEWTTDSEGASVEYSEDGKSVNLISADGTELSNHNGNVLWNAKLDNVPENGTQTESIKVTDSDGDSVSLDIVATNTTEPIEDTVVGLDGVTSQVNPGENYNISVILDTSGSMYSDDHKDIAGEESRLELAVDAIKDFVTNVLYTHANSEIGGVVNLHVTTFWNNTQGGAGADKSGDAAGDGDGVEMILQFDLSKTSLEDVLAQLDSIITNNQEAPGDWLDGNDAGFHWGTNFEKGFNSSAEWFNSEEISGNGYTNEVFFLSDGEPHQGDSDAGYKNLVDAIGPDGVVHAVGMGEGANLTTLNKYDTDGKATLVKDDDIKDIFKPEEGGVDVATVTTSVGVTGEGNDVLIGGIDTSVLKAWIAKQLNVDAESISDSQLSEYMRNYPEWINDQDLDNNTLNDPDALVAGAGDDVLYGQGGEDLLIGDGDASSLEKFAEELGMENSADYAKENITTPENMNEDEAEAFTENIQNLVIDLVDVAQSVDVETLENAAKALESDTDGNDTLYGGDSDAEGLGGDDLLLGLGGDDLIYGGEGNDIILGGSGDDTIYGGEGNDTLIGGEGDDLIVGGAGSDILFGGSGNDTFFFTEDSFVPGEKDEIKDLSEGDMIDLSSFKENGYTIEIGTGENNQDITISNGTDIFTISTNINLTDDDIEFDMESNIINI